MGLRLHFGKTRILLYLLLSEPSWHLAAVVVVTSSVITTVQVGLLAAKPVSACVFLQAAKPLWAVEPGNCFSSHLTVLIGALCVFARASGWEPGRPSL